MRALRNWLATRMLWHRLWRQLVEMDWLVKAGRGHDQFRQLAPFKAFEAWTDDARLHYKAGRLNETVEAIDAAMQLLTRLDEDVQRKLLHLAAKARHEEYMLQVAELCQ